MIKLLDIANDLNKQKTNEGFKEKALALATAAGMAYGGYKKYVANDRPPKPETIQTVSQEPSVSFEDQYRTSAESILDNIEGAYVNPSKLKGEKEKKIFSSSGETMYGIDRLTGGKKNKTPKGKEFWRLIDRDKKVNPEKWVRYYRGGEMEDKLKTLAIDIMEPEFKRLFKTLSPESQEIVEADPRLFFHFVYAAWNGSGHFNDFAKAINRRVREGNDDPDYLFDAAMNDRIDKGGIIRQKADKVRQAAEDLFF